MEDDTRLVGPEPLSNEHQVKGFDCGDPALNDYLRHQALQDQRADKSRSYVVCSGREVAGYFTMAASSVEPDGATARATKGQGSQPIPAVLIGRLGVDRRHQGLGIGEALLVEALAKAEAAGELIGARVVLVHAKPEDAARFYRRYGFEESPINSLHLMILMKDVRRSLARRR